MLMSYEGRSQEDGEDEYEGEQGGKAQEGRRRQGAGIIVVAT